MDETLLARILEALHREEVRYTVIGAVALNLHGIVRTSEDLDIFIMKRGTVRPKDRADAEELRRRFGLAEDA